MHPIIDDEAQLAAHWMGGRPPVLHHYTGQAGLIGIMTNGTIWASSNQFLNDQKELVLATDHARQRIEALRRAATSPAHAAHLDEMEGRISGLEYMNIFVTSFCVDGDLLSQWRGYSGASSGFSLCFETAALDYVARHSGFLLLPCIYEPARQVAAVNRVVDAYASPGSNLDEYLDVLGVIGCMVKHDAFAAECEWRLISPPDHAQTGRLPKLPAALKFRPGASTIVPYIEVPIRDEHGNWPIRHIIYGPTPHKVLAARMTSFLNSTVSQQGIGGSPSSIPYRTW